MDSDDTQIGRLLTRREALAVLGVSGAALLMGGAPHPGGPRRLLAAGFPRCLVRPEQTAGPYFVDELLNRSDVRSDPTTGAVSEGAPLELEFQVSQVRNGGCAALAGAQVDIWQCDALGVYSDVTDPGFNTVGRKFLRGHQITDAAGKARFTTIYPGWYPGRAVHIHFKIRTGPRSGKRHEFVSQVYFDEAYTDGVHAVAPYVKPGQRTRNDSDQIYRRGGPDLMLAVTQAPTGHAGTFDIGLQMP